jgi:flagellar basal-body rod modification protein FlgD
MPSANPMFGSVTQTGATSMTSSSKSTASMNGMGKDTFMKLLVAQMSQQNPMEPSDDKEMIAQMTQFSMLEQITNMATANAEQATASKMGSAVSLIGRQVSYLDADGNKQSGVVSQVQMVNGLPQLTVGDKTGISTSQLNEVR